MVPQFLLNALRGIFAAALRVLAHVSVVAQVVCSFQTPAWARSSASILPKSSERIEVRCPSRGKIACYSGHGEQQQGQPDEGRRVGRLHSEKKRRKSPCQQECHRQANR